VRIHYGTEEREGVEVKLVHILQLGSSRTRSVTLRIGTLYATYAVGRSYWAERWRRRDRSLQYSRI